ncbi:hypothetical protein INT45_005260 [Circinella minor]|uniref:Uncharacterized protein n=1 Tax=Circinella minor TaxID=1195481 RepID=A0A8H7VFR3_9FUNG|nr:hypothetical protein INT45_005260 [Circinella minor]
MDKSLHTVTCISKCGIANYDLVYCKKCPKYRVPQVLLQNHLFSMTPEISRIAIHIAQWPEDEYKHKAPGSLKAYLNEGLPSGPKPAAMEGDFQYRSCARNKAPEGIVYPGNDAESSHYWSISLDEAAHYPGSASDGCETFSVLRKQGDSRINIMLQYDDGSKFKLALENTPLLAGIKDAPIPVGVWGLTLTLALDPYVAQRRNNIGSSIECYMGNLGALEESWNKHVKNIEESFSVGTPCIKRVAIAIERLCVAVETCDIIDQAFKNDSNGTKLAIYKGFRGPHGHDVEAIITSSSEFHNDRNLLTTMDSSAPYDAYHGLQRAIEEFAMLKDEAALVIKHGKDIVNKLEVGVNVLLLPSDI